MTRGVTHYLPKLTRVREGETAETLCRNVVWLEKLTLKPSGVEGEAVSVSGAKSRFTTNVDGDVTCRQCAKRLDAARARSAL